MRDSMMGRDYGQCLSKYRDKCSKSKTDIWTVYWSLCISDKIKSHSFRN